MNDFATTYETLMRLSQTVKQTRTNLGLTGKHLASNLGLGKNTISRFEGRGYGDFEVLLKLLRWLDEQEETDAYLSRNRLGMVPGYGEQVRRAAAGEDLGRIAR